MNQDGKPNFLIYKLEEEQKDFLGDVPDENVEVDETSTPQLPRITCMQTPIIEREKKKLWRLEFPNPEV